MCALRKDGEGSSTTRTVKEVCTKTCPDCNKQLPRTTDYFYRHKRGKYGYYLDTYCIKCRKKRQKIVRQAQYKDPVKHERLKAQKRAANLRHRERNPESYYASQKKWEQKQRTDPVKHAALLERRRMEYRLRRERDGFTVRTSPPTLYPVVNYDKIVPVAPFTTPVRNYIITRFGPLVERGNMDGGIKPFCEMVELDDKIIGKILSGHGTIYLTTADKLCTRLSLPLNAYLPDHLTA